MLGIAGSEALWRLQGVASLPWLKERPYRLAMSASYSAAGGIGRQKHIKQRALLASRLRSSFA
jgi:hypothetical protein